MKNIRWYDKNPNLKDLFEYIETLDKGKQNDIAQDILQILISDYKIDLDGKLNSIGENYTYECKRWYDNNIDLFTSFDIIKGFPAEAQNHIAQKILSSLLLTYLSEENQK